MMKRGILLAVALVLAASAAGAQPTPDQSPSPGSSPDPHARGAKVREACKADIETLCAGVDPGRPMFQCVRAHHDALSDGCKAALSSLHGDHQGHGAPPDGAPSPQQ